MENRQDEMNNLISGDINKQVEIDFIVWAEVKYFDKFKGLANNAAAEHRLEEDWMNVVAA
jgi:hypothetical protein